MSAALTLFWFRRDLRLDDNAGLYHALKKSKNVQPLFIFDKTILQSLSSRDARVAFIHQTIENLKRQLQELGSDLWVFYGKPEEIFKDLFENHSVSALYFNHDYEPYAVERDLKIEKLAHKKEIATHSFKDHAIFERNEIKTDAGKPYTVFTPYKKKWLKNLKPFYYKPYPTSAYTSNLHSVKKKTHLISLSEMGFENSELSFPSSTPMKKIIKDYQKTRDYPFLDQGTSRLGVHFRFGTISPREWVSIGLEHSETWLSELIWRDFFMQILWHFPHVAHENFRKKFDLVSYRDDKKEFKKWCDGETGYPLVDAGMRELNQTGHMHNRVRMVTAAFLTKHLFMHWSLGERYFADRLLDYDLAANNGNWQWAAGSGCDAAPYFRIFNPITQQEKFDPDFKYIKKWVPEYGTAKYPPPMVDHVFARERALKAFKSAFKNEDV